MTAYILDALYLLALGCAPAATLALIGVLTY